MDLSGAMREVCTPKIAPICSVRNFVNCVLVAYLGQQFDISDNFGRNDYCCRNMLHD